MDISRARKSIRVVYQLLELITTLRAGGEDLEWVVEDLWVGGPADGAAEEEGCEGGDSGGCDDEGC